MSPEYNIVIVLAESTILSHELMTEGKWFSGRTYQLVRLSNLWRKARDESARAANGVGREPIG